ncbi:MAG: M28 family peptidase [Chloroflexota bacterium]
MRSRPLVLLLVLFIAACTQTSIQRRQPEDVFDGDRAFEHVKQQMEFGPRPSGSLAIDETRSYFENELQSLGWTVEFQEFKHNGITCQNIIARLPSEPQDEAVLLIGAHYDTRWQADLDPDYPEQPVPGANDGASGTAVLLELARTLNTGDSRVWLVFFDAEDNGSLPGWDWILGSSHFVEQLTTPIRSVIIVDMVGDKDLDIYYERNSDLELQQQIWEAAADLGYSDVFIPLPRHSILDDHTPFLRKGIQAVDIIDFDYPFYHTTEDTLDKISSLSLEIVGRTVEYYIESRSLDSLSSSE